MGHQRNSLPKSTRQKTAKNSQTLGKDVMDAEAEKTFVWGPWVDGPADGLNGWAESSRDIVSSEETSTPFLQLRIGESIYIYLNWLAGGFFHQKRSLGHMSHLYTHSANG